MQILLACAKIMNTPSPSTIARGREGVTLPRFDQEANTIAAEMGRHDVESLMEMFHCSRHIALDNKLRYQHFFDDEQRMPALAAYYGQAYKCLQAQTLGDDAWHYGQQHLWMTSFLYGLLRPMDAIHAYRMEGNVRLETTHGQTLFDYWKPRLTSVLIQAVKEDDGVLVHLATEEMEHLFDWKQVTAAVRVIQPKFLVMKDGKPKTVTVYAKSCRGAMTRYLLQQRCRQVADLHGFEYQGFCFADGWGDEDHPHYII